MNKKLQIVIDAQNDFITEALRNEQAIAAVPNLVARIKAHDGAVIATHDTHFNKTQVESNWPPYPNSQVYEKTLEGQKLPVPHCIKLTEGWEIQKDILAALNEKNANGPTKFFAVDKYTFGKIDWAAVLTGMDFDEIEIFGFCTDICVISNALILRAMFPNMKITVVKDCCAGVTPELHEAALKVMQSCQIDVE